MKNHTVIELKDRESIADPMMDLLRLGAKKLVKEAVLAEVEDLLSQYADQKTKSGHAGVVLNGSHPERLIQTGIGSMSVKIPKVRSRLGDALTFRSALVPPYLRKTASLEAGIPWLYLKGISSGEMDEALKVLLGPGASGLSTSTVSRLKLAWAEDYRKWRARDLSKDRWVYIWADGIYSGLRGEREKLCALVIIGVNSQGEKHFLGIEDGVRESTQSWREVLLKLKSQGMNNPKLAVGDGAMGFWSALEEIYPETAQQRCWVHKTANVLNALPKSLQAKGKQAVEEIYMSDTRKNAVYAFDLFVKTYEAKYPKATHCLQKDREELLAFYDFPALHWQSIRTSNPIESTFGTIRHRTKRSKGCLSREGMLHMMFKLSQCAERKWRKLRGFNTLTKVIQGVQFKDGLR
ncbi:MAG: IS256 family transposase [Nitrospirota bacterium]|nr:IS256 family transposase [Nitrospirota bacterium]